MVVRKTSFFLQPKAFFIGVRQRAMIKKAIFKLSYKFNFKKPVLKNRLFFYFCFFFLTDFFVQINSNDTDTAGYTKNQHHSNKISGNQRSPARVDAKMDGRRAMVEKERIATD